MNAFDILKERGFIAQCSNEQEIRESFEKGQVTMYCGYDATADSLTAGHFLTLMALSHLQQAGHRPLILIGGGTAMIGDPSGKTDMRKMLTIEDINYNAECFKKQMSRFMDFSDGKVIMDNNANWLLGLEYLPFLRDIAVHFSVNRMLSAECYKSRLEEGLTLFEFNYMVMQSYDFLELYKRYGCTLQVGGDDQWSNMLGGIDLIRKKEHASANVMTFTLLTTSEGKKMGKTEKGALWLDPAKTTPYEFYQYWRNVEDVNVEKCLGLLTFLPMDEVRKLGTLKDAEINKAKEILAYEVTKIVHGEEEAKKAQEAAQALFSTGSDMSNVPSFELEKDGVDIISLLVTTKLAPSRAEARRLVEQGGVIVGGEKIDNINYIVTKDAFKNKELIIQKGKKTFLKLVIK
ncbi:MAG TPA: tyrosine--tRNA ligase [Clostridiales bacterium]|nr:MAG: tyrosine--tRNA ligase [Clostridiales bacterium GWD2_32_19]HCC08000.1 tyrosine--tRNA ligase [Clostridiales bacterium]